MSLGLPKLVERHIAPEPNTGCWLWTAYLTEDGYGRCKVGGRQRGAHRAVYEFLVGPIPAQHEIDHLCRVRCCVNPEHLEVVTKKENVARGVGVGVINRLRTSCKNGHPFTASNTRLVKARRYCRRCGIIATQRWTRAKEKIS